MDSLASAKGVDLAMNYDDWFPQRPATWTKVEDMQQAVRFPICNACNKVVSSHTGTYLEIIVGSYVL
jgi:hypothetical protein